jgi:hypothetical protein
MPTKPTGRPGGRPAKPKPPGFKRNNLGINAATKAAAAAGNPIDARLAAREKVLIRRREMAATLTRKAIIAAAEQRQTLAQEVVDANHPCLKYMNRADRLAWLCLQVHREHEEEKVVSLGQGMGYDIARVGTEEPKFRAMEMLMKALGDYAPTTAVQVNQNGETGDTQVVLMVADNGRG